MAKKRDRGGAATIAELLAKVLPAHGAEASAEVLVYTWWRAAVPERVAKNARPARVRKGLLTIHTTTSGWASEVDLMQTQLLASLAARHPNLGIRKLRAKVGPMPAPPMRPRARPPLPPPVPLREVPDEVARALAQVRSDALRDAISEAARTSLAPRPTRAATESSKRKRAP